MKNNNKETIQAKAAAASETVIKGHRKNLGNFKTTISRTTVGGVVEPYKYERESIDTSGYSKGKPVFDLITERGEGDKITGSKPISKTVKKVDRKSVLSVLERLK